MSLYADEDLATLSSAGPSTYAAPPTVTLDIDPLTAFSNAVALPAESPAQAEGLVKAGQRFEDVPDRLPELCAQLLPMVVDGGDTLLRKWTLEMVLLAVGRSRLGGEVKVQVAQTSLTALLNLLSSPSPSTVKSTIHVFATIYSILFRLLASGTAPPGMLDAFNQSKARIISLTVDPEATPASVAQNVGVKAAGWKFVQRVMLVGTRASADPRLAKAQGNDPNISMLTYASPLNANELETEASGLRNQLIAQLFQQDVPAILHPIFNIIPLLCKARPTLAPAYITTLTSWSPAQLEAKRRSGMQIRAVEKTLRSVMAHLLRHPPLAMFSVQLNDALQRQKSRLEVSWETEQNVRRAKRAAAVQGMPPSMAPSSTQGAGAGSSHLGKHGHAEDVKPDWYGGYAAYGGQQPAQGQGMLGQGQVDGHHDAKRPRLDHALGTGRGHAIDVSGMRLEMVLDLVMTGLRALDQEAIPRAIDNARRNLEQGNADAMPQLAPMLGLPLPGRGMYDRQPYADGGRAMEVKEEKEEVLDPLEMDMDDDDLLAEDESDVDENITFADFTLPPPEPLSPLERDELIDDILERISASGQEMSGPIASTGGNDPWAWLTSASSDKVKVEGRDGLRGIMDVKEMWMVLLSRLATRTGTLMPKSEDGVQEEDVVVRSKGRARVAEFIAADFAARSKFAALWLNEEWFTEKTSLGTTITYTTHLLSILSSHLSKLDAHSSSSAAARSLSLFLANIPEIPLSLIDQLAAMAEDADRAIVGLLALRDLVESRPPVRAKALSCLLDLCVHPDRKVRVLGISTVRRWVPGHRVSKEVVGFAEKVLARLGYAREETVKEGKQEDGKVEVEGKEDGNGVAEAGAESRADVEMDADAKAAPVEVPGDLADLSHFLPLPSPKSIQQHVELPFALSRRDPALLDSIFALYPTLPPFIQGQYEDLLVPLIQSLAVGPVAAPPTAPPSAPKGPAADKESHKGTDGAAAGETATAAPAAPTAPTPQTPSEKLMGLLTEYPADGTEKLVLRVISTLSKEGKSATVRDLVRIWMEQKGEDVDVRFVVPVLGELTRAEIEVQIPRIVMLLNTPDSRDTVRTAFATLIQKLTPADLLVALHNESTPIKPTIEAIGICFSMTTVFRSDVLVASMVRIADLPNGSLPIVFMRTIIQAVTTYKSLIPFVANTVLPKLVGKKIWSAGPQLWDGFVKLAKLIAPASYGVLLQLPKEWLKDVLEKQPALKNGLKTFLAAKQGGRGVLVELFGEA